MGQAVEKSGQCRSKRTWGGVALTDSASGPLKWPSRLQDAMSVPHCTHSSSHVFDVMLSASRLGCKGMRNMQKDH
eukprot:4697309-Alexandrium_andersonii.AAC.1